MTRDATSALPAKFRAHADEALASMTAKQRDRIAGITTRPHEAHPKWSTSGMIVGGVYDSKNGMVHVNPGQPWMFKENLAHELGHSVTWNMAGTQAKRIGKGFARIKGMGRGDLRGLGLRANSQKSEREFSADVYMVHKVGHPDYQKSLAKMLGVRNLGDLFDE